MSKIKLNGEYTEEELLKLIEESKKPVWSVTANKGNIGLVRKDILIDIIWEKDYSFQVNMYELIFKIAGYLGALATNEQIINNANCGSIYFDIRDMKFDYFIFNNFHYGVVIKNFKSAELVISILNDPILLSAIKESLAKNE